MSDGFRYDAQLEAKARLREERPEAYEQLPTKVRLQLGYYENAKKAAEAAGLETSDPRVVA
jgi:hypothetical protein